MILTHIFLRDGCRWVWQWLSPAARLALPRVTALALACGGPTTRLPAASAPVSVPPVERPRHTERAAQGVYLPTVWRSEDVSPSILVYLPPAPIDLRPAVAPDDLAFIPARYEVEDHHGHGGDRVPVSDVPEPSSLVILAAVGLLAVRKREPSDG